MNNNICGIIEYNDKKYPFSLVGKIVEIVGEPTQYLSDFDGVEEIEIIKGVTSKNRDICFLRCHFIKNCSMLNPVFSIQGYAISNSNTGITCDFKYNRSEFESDALNCFFSPQKAIKCDVDIKDWTGEINIKVSPFTDTIKEFDYKDSKCQLSIARYVCIIKEPTTIGRVNALFSFEYNQEQLIVKIVDDYLALYDFLSFVNNNSNISFKSINVSKKNNGRFEKNATVYIFTDKSEYENTYINSITIDDIPEQKLSNIFYRVTSLRGKDSRLRYYFPENNREGKYIDPGKWMIMALNLEGLFSETFPNYKCEKNKDFRKAKSLALKQIEDCTDVGKLSKKGKEYYQKCREQIEHYEGQLEEKFNYLFNENKVILNNIISYNEKQFSVSVLDNYGKIYANYRNKIAHGSVEPLSNKEVAVYRILQPLIYILLLSGLDLSDEEKKKIIEKLFR